MFKTTLFRKQLVILLLVTIVFAVVAMFVSDRAVRAMMSWSSKEDTTGGPTQGFVRLLDALTSDGKLTLEDAADRINRGAPPHRKIGLRIVDAEALRKDIGVDPAAVPSDPFQAHSVREDDLRFPRLSVFRAKSDPNKYLVFDRPEPMGPGGPGGPPPPGGPHGPHRGPPPIFLWTFLALILSGFLAAAISLFLLFSSMRRKARQAADVINAIKQGDWQKRMPIDGVDEVGNLMQEFNRMADEIESAVRSMQRSEASRTTLLQELAHDLRTPIASLRGLIETIEMRNAALDANKRAELFSLAQKEIDYFARLIEDLLFLAQVRDPRYLNAGKSVDLTALVKEQCDQASANRGVSISFHPGQAPFKVRGDEILLKRLVRNAIDNATSYAKSQIEIQLLPLSPITGAAPSVKLIVRDDGPGFSQQALATFGEKRFSRFVAGSEGDRLSVGLGSVIMTTVAQVHGGHIAAQNQAGGGGEITVVLPVN